MTANQFQEVAIFIGNCLNYFLNDLKALTIANVTLFSLFLFIATMSIAITVLRKLGK